MGWGVRNPGERPRGAGGLRDRGLGAELGLCPTQAVYKRAAVFGCEGSESLVKNANDLVREAVTCRSGTLLSFGICALSRLLDWRPLGVCGQETVPRATFGLCHL